MIKVYSGRPEELEAGFGPHLEAVFKDNEVDRAKKYIAEWERNYPNWNTIFWLE